MENYFLFSLECVKILKQLFASGSVIFGEYSSRLRRVVVPRHLTPNKHLYAVTPSCKQMSNSMPEIFALLCTQCTLVKIKSTCL